MKGQKGNQRCQECGVELVKDGSEFICPECGLVEENCYEW